MAGKQQIQVEGVAEAGEAQHVEVGGLPSLARVERQLVLPTQSALQNALEAATGSEELASLRQVAAAYQDLGERLKLAKDELVRVAIWRIDVERKLGEELARTVGRGGSGSNLHAASSKRGGSSRGLPKEVNWSASKRYQDLAAIPPEVLQDYLSRVAKRGGVPSPGGARSFALRQGKASSPRPRKAKKVRAGEPGVRAELSPVVMEAIERFLGRVDVLVGAAAVRAKVRVDPQVASQGQAEGLRVRRGVPRPSHMDAQAGFAAPVGIDRAGPRRVAGACDARVLP